MGNGCVGNAIVTGSVGERVDRTPHSLALGQQERAHKQTLPVLTSNTSSSALSSSSTGVVFAFFEPLVTWQRHNRAETRS